MSPADQDLKQRFPEAENAPVLQYLQKTAPTASAELVQEVRLAAAELKDAPGGGALSYCPDETAFAYVVLYSPGGIIYALAEDDGRLVLRLPNVMEPPSLGDAAFIHARLADATKRFWGAFPVFAEDTIDREQDEARAIVKKWLLRAREFAEEATD